MDAVSGLLILDDASLVRRAQGGDRAAFSALVERHYGLAHGCAWRRTGNRADAEDIAQDVMAKLGGAIFSLKEPAALRGFLLRLTINAVTDFFRRRSREARGNTAYFTDPSVHFDEEVEGRARDHRLVPHRPKHLQPEEAAATGDDRPHHGRAREVRRP